MSYKSYLRSIGRKPLRGPLRTSKKPGDVEVGAWDARVGDYVKHVHEGEETGNVVQLKRRARA